ncbi:hypothetical protein OSTOST_06069 [Ostertagia ostertagi]
MRKRDTQAVFQSATGTPTDMNQLCTCYLGIFFAIRSFASMPAEAFKKHEVVPDVLATAPTKVVKASYDSGAEVNLKCYANE